MTEPAPFDYSRLAHPPVTFGHEKKKLEERIPAARAYILKHGLNELMPGSQHPDLGLVVQGGLRILDKLDKVDAFEQRPLLKGLDWVRMVWRAVWM